MKRLNRFGLAITFLVLGLVFPSLLLAATTATIAPNPKFTAMDSNGDPYVGGKLYTFETGTTTAKASWTDSTKGTPNTNPVVLDNRGQADIWIDSSGGAYRFRLDSADDVTIWTVNNVNDFTMVGGYSTLTLPTKADSLIVYDDNASEIKKLAILNLLGNVHFPDYNEADQGVVGSGSSVKTFVDAISADSTTLVFRHNSGAATTTYTFSTSETIPSNINVIIEKGAILSIATAQTLTINGPFDAGLYQKFSGNGSVVFGAESIEKVYSQWWGAVGNGTADDTVAIQAALGCFTSGGVVDLCDKSYRIARNTGINDRWGINITNSDIVLQGNKATIRRYDTDISTYALAYPIILVGTPDSDVASAVENITIRGIHFVGEDTRHATSGSTLHDGRHAIEFKNTSNTEVSDCKFTKIDSQAIFYQEIGVYDYATPAWYNTTKNYNSKVINNSFIAESHAVAFRALIHAIYIAGVDYVIIENNYFEWCDDAISGNGTYDTISKTEDDTYTDSNLGVAVKRVGRNVVIANNTIYNSSEHAIYMGCLDASITGNVLRTDDLTLCYGNIKCRGRNVVIAGNTIVVHGTAIIIAEASYNIMVSGNTIRSDGDTTGGVIDINSNDLTNFIDNRSDWFGSYILMTNISINGNSISLPSTANTAGDGNAIRIYSNAVDANYPEGQIRGVAISDNVIKNHRTGVYIVGQLAKNISIIGNTFDAKPFVSAGFAAGTTLNTHTTLMVQNDQGDVLREVSFAGNSVSGSAYLFATDNDAGASVFTPQIVNDNIFSYIKNYAMDDFRGLSSNYNSFKGNTGTYFLDRTSKWLNKYGVDNTLRDGTTIATWNTRYTSHDYGGAAADWNLSVQENLADYILVSNANGAVNAILPSCVDGHTYTVLNTSGQILTFKVTGQTGGTIANGKLAVYSAGATDVFEVWEQP